jgi:hypothetical protein
VSWSVGYEIRSVFGKLMRHIMHEKEHKLEDVEVRIAGRGAAYQNTLIKDFNGQKCYGWSSGHLREKET